MAASPNRILATIVGALVAVVVAVAVVAATRPPPELDVGTPQGIVQAYVRAVFDGEIAEAAGHITAESECGVEDLERARAADSARVVLLDTRVDGDSASVEVEIVHSGGSGPFDGYEWSEETTFSLIRSGGTWQLTGEPWPLYFCRGDDQ